MVVLFKERFCFVFLSTICDFGVSKDTCWFLAFAQTCKNTQGILHFHFIQNSHFLQDKKAMEADGHASTLNHEAFFTELLADVGERPRRPEQPRQRQPKRGRR